MLAEQGFAKVAEVPSIRSTDNFHKLRELLRCPWNPASYQEPIPPLVVAEVDADLLSQPLPDVLDMAIKVPGSELVLPSNVRPLLDYVLFCADVHADLVDNPEDYYSYLTINQGLVLAGQTQRNSGVHFDGMQGVRYGEKLPACHQFLVSSALPTTWHVQPFNTTGLNPETDNWFTAFEKQADRSRETLWKPNPREVVLSTAYGVHESTEATEDTDRTFVRVEFSMKQADRIGNTVSQLSEDWEWHPRPIPQNLN